MAIFDKFMKGEQAPKPVAVDSEDKEMQDALQDLLRVREMKKRYPNYEANPDYFEQVEQQRIQKENYLQAVREANAEKEAAYIKRAAEIRTVLRRDQGTAAQQYFVFDSDGREMKYGDSGYQCQGCGEVMDAIALEVIMAADERNLADAVNPTYYALNHGVAGNVRQASHMYDCPKCKKGHGITVVYIPRNRK